MSGLILIVDDEEDLLTTLAYNLEREGFQTRTAGNGQTAIARCQQAPLPGLVLLDLMLPDISGTEVCKRLREDPRTRKIPILMLTAKASEVDRVVGFEVGADDYVVKPFSVRELILRVKAIMRRAEAPEEPSEPQTIGFGPLRVDAGAHRVWVDDQELTLTALEFKLVSFFLARRGRVQTRDQLLTDVWGMSADVTTRTVDTHVKRLRQKLGQAGVYIETVRGVGYRWRPQPDLAAAD